MKRILALLLTLMMALSLTACGGDNAKVAGTWKWNCDITEVLLEPITKSIDVDIPAEAMEVKAEMPYILTFNEDGTFIRYVDRDALNASLQGFLNAVMLPAMMENTYQDCEARGMSRAEFDELLKTQGLTMEEFVQDQIDSVFNVDEMVESLCQYRYKGYFRVSGGRLFTSETEGSFDQDDYIEYTLENGVMKWTGGTAMHLASGDEPVEWVKQQ